MGLPCAASTHAVTHARRGPTQRCPRNRACQYTYTQTHKHTHSNSVAANTRAQHITRRRIPTSHAHLTHTTGPNHHQQEQCIFARRVPHVHSWSAPHECKNGCARTRLESIPHCWSRALGYCKGAGGQTASSRWEKETGVVFLPGVSNRAEKARVRVASAKHDGMSTNTHGEVRWSSA